MINIISKRDVLALLVGLKQANDLHLILEKRVFDPTLCLSNERDKIIRLAELIDSLIDQYDYFETEDFLSSIIGKSEKFVLMKKKLFSNEKAEKLLDEFGESVVRILESDEAFRYGNKAFDEDLIEVKNLVNSLSNPKCCRSN